MAPDKRVPTVKIKRRHKCNQWYTKTQKNSNFKCKICQKKFTKKDNRNRHQKNMLIETLISAPNVVKYLIIGLPCINIIVSMPQITSLLSLPPTLPKEQTSLFQERSLTTYTFLKPTIFIQKN